MQFLHLLPIMVKKTLSFPPGIFSAALFSVYATPGISPVFLCRWVPHLHVKMDLLWPPGLMPPDVKTQHHSVVFVKQAREAQIGGINIWDGFKLLLQQG